MTPERRSLYRLFLAMDENQRRLRIATKASSSKVTFGGAAAEQRVALASTWTAEDYLLFEREPKDVKVSRIPLPNPLDPIVITRWSV